MRPNEKMLWSRPQLSIAVALVVIGWLDVAYCRTNDPVLLLQQTPAEGGTITPATGVHHFALNADVTLTAVAKPGYRFVYWLGDVTDPTSHTTVVRLDAPKIVIAVFERTEYEFLLDSHMVVSAPAGGLYFSAPGIGRRGYGGPGGRRPPKSEAAEPVSDEFPVPVPEPATGALLGLATLLTYTVRSRETRRMRRTDKDSYPQTMR